MSGSVRGHHAEHGADLQSLASRQHHERNTQDVRRRGDASSQRQQSPGALQSCREEPGPGKGIAYLHIIEGDTLASQCLRLTMSR
jgi:hypothetical protein